MRKLTSRGGFGLAVALCLVGCQKEGLTVLDSGISPGTGGTSATGSQGGAGGPATGGANGHGGSVGGVGGVPGTGGQLASGGSMGSGGNVGAGGSATGGRDASVDAGCPAGWTPCCGQCLSPQAGICSMPCLATGGAIATGGATSSGGKTGAGGATSSGGVGGSKTGSGGAKTGGAGGNSGGTGGTSHDDGGQPADGGVSCTDLENAYAAALPAARSCDVAAAGQCQQSVSSSLSPCFVNCMTYVNNASTLNKLKLTWQQGGCNSLVGILCPAIACIAPTAGVCGATDGGGGVCTDQSLGATTAL